MENESKLSKILAIIMIIYVVALGAVLCFEIQQDSRERQELVEQAKIDAQVDVNRIDDSTYHFNLGDGSSCFKLELANDTLTVYMVNVILCHIENDTITVITMRNKAEHKYQFNYSHYFNGSVQEKSKVKFLYN